MNNGINLVVKRIDPEVEALQKKIKVFRTIAVVILTCITLASGVLFVMIAASPLPQLRQEEQRLFASLNESNSTIQRSILIDKQLEHVDSILTSRSELPITMREILLNTPPSLTIISYTATDDQFEVTIQATSLSEIDSFFNSLRVLAEQEKIYRNITLETLSVSQAQGAYQFRVLMTN